jgi:aminopeptidase N
MNQGFDYILVHETAHEWWGNAVSARDWGDFWIHEGFASYAEAVFLERSKGRSAADAWFERARESIPATAKLHRGAGADSGAAYSVTIYNHGAWVLHTLRHCVADDKAWWKALRDFNLEFRGRNAGTDDFRAVLERATSKNWKPFFEEFVYGAGYPELSGTVRARARGLEVDVVVRGSSTTSFHVPIDVTWKAGAESGTRAATRP